MLRALKEDLPADLPMAASARGMLARVLINLGDPAEAADVAALDAGPGAPIANVNLHAAALIAAGKLDEASVQVDRLAVAAPDDSDTVTLRARLMRARGQGEEAAQALERSALERLNGPGGEAVGRNVVRILMEELNQPAAAERLARKLKAAHPKTAGVLGYVMAKTGRVTEAMDLYRDAVNVADPTAVREAVRNALGLVALHKNELPLQLLAESIVDDARKRDPGSSDLLAMAGYLRHFQGRFDDELKLYEAALGGKPEDFAFLNNMAWTLSENKNQPDQALEKINEAIRRTPLPPPQYFDTRGVILTRLNRIDEAIRDLEAAVRDRPTGMVWAHLARAYHKAKRDDDFRRARDEAKRAGLTPEKIDKEERADLEPLLFGGDSA